VILKKLLVSSELIEPKITKLLVVIIFITLTIVSPISSYFLHRYQYQPSFISLIVVHIVFGLAALSSVLLVWLLLTSKEIHKFFGILDTEPSKQRIIASWRLTPPSLISILVPTVAAALLLLNFKLIGFYPVIHISLQALLLSLFVAWFTTTTLRPPEELRGTGSKRDPVLGM
jgi:hypothetical protein